MDKPNLDQTEKNRLASSNANIRPITTEQKAASPSPLQQKILETLRAEPITPGPEEITATQPSETTAPTVNRRRAAAIRARRGPIVHSVVAGAQNGGELQAPSSGHRRPGPLDQMLPRWKSEDARARDGRR